MGGINQINAARNQAATAKAQQRMELFTNAQNAIANLKQQYDQFQQSLQQWSVQKSSSLTPLASDPNHLASFMQGLNYLQQAPGINQYNITGEVGTSAGGNPYTGYTIKRREDENGIPSGASQFGVQQY